MGENCGEIVEDAEKMRLSITPPRYIAAVSAQSLCKGESSVIFILWISKIASFFLRLLVNTQEEKIKLLGK